MEPRSLTSSRLYFDEVLEPNRKAYFEGPVTFVSAFNLAASLFHFHEWLFHDYEAELITLFGIERRPAEEVKPGAFWSKVEITNERFGYIRDVANASKHVVLTRRRSTEMKNIGQAAMSFVGHGMGDYGTGRYGGATFVIVNAGEPVSFDECASAMFSYWSGLLGELTKAQGSELTSV